MQANSQLSHLSQHCQKSAKNNSSKFAMNLQMGDNGRQGKITKFQTSY